MLAVLTCSLSVLWSQSIQEKYGAEANAEESVSVVSTPEPVISPPGDKYVLKILDGIVVVFNTRDMTRPIMVTDIYASTLRHLDREKLNEGVLAEDDFELQRLLEDYSS